MDNLTHSLAGWAIGQAGLKKKSRKGLAALILAANAPDIDVFFGWVAWEPLAMHRGFTHSLIGGFLVLPPLLWALLLALDRWQVKRGVSFKSGLAMDSSWLLALCYIGALTHPLLDLLTTYSVQLFSPISGRWFHLDGLFIIDWVVWLTLILGIARSQGREARGLADSGRPARIALVAAFAYICFNIGLGDAATRTVKARHPGASAIFASPPPLAFWNRTMVWRQGDAFGGAEWRFFGGLGHDRPLIPTNMNDPAVYRIVRLNRDFRGFFGWSTMTYAQIARDGCTARIVFGDARYLELRARTTFRREAIMRTC